MPRKTRVCHGDEDLVSGPSAQNEEEKASHSLAAECQKLSDKILELIEKTNPKNQKSKTQVVFTAIIGKPHEDNKLQLDIGLAALDRFVPQTCVIK